MELGVEHLHPDRELSHTAASAPARRSAAGRTRGRWTRTPPRPGRCGFPGRARRRRGESGGSCPRGDRARAGIRWFPRPGQWAGAGFRRRMGRQCWQRESGHWLRVAPSGTAGPSDAPPRAWRVARSNRPLGCWTRQEKLAVARKGSPRQRTKRPRREQPPRTGSGKLAEGGREHTGDGTRRALDLTRIRRGGEADSQAGGSGIVLPPARDKPGGRAEVAQFLVLNRG